MSERRIGRDMTEGNIFRQLVAFVMPILLTNVIQQLYNIVDLAVIGQFGGATGTVGVSTGGEIANLLLFVCTGFASAGEVYISQLSGAKDKEGITHTIGTMMTTMAGMALVFAIVSMACCRPLLELLNTPGEAFEEAYSYMMITSLGLPFVFIYNGICSVLRGMGESKRPLYFIIVAASANVVMDLFFVVVLHMGAAGTAWATIIAQIASCVAAWLFMYKNRQQFGFDFRLRSFAIRREPLLVLLRLGIPKIIQQVCIHVTQLFCNAQVNDYGLVASAVNSVGNKVVRLVNIIVNSIDVGAAVMVGQNLSVQKHDRVKKIVMTSLWLSLIFCAINCMLALFLPRAVFSIFSNDPAVIEQGVDFMHIAICTFILSVFQGAYGSVVTGSGNASLGLLTGLLDGILLRVVISLVFARTLGMGVTGFFWGNSLPRLAPVVINMAYFYSGKWKTRRLLTKKKEAGKT